MYVAWLEQAGLNRAWIIDGIRATAMENPRHKKGRLATAFHSLLYVLLLVLLLRHGNGNWPGGTGRGGNRATRLGIRCP